MAGVEVEIGYTNVDSLAHWQSVPVCHKHHSVIAHAMAAFVSCFKEVSHLRLGQEILPPRVNGGVGTDDCSHHQHIPGSQFSVTLFLYKTVKML